MPPSRVVLLLLYIFLQMRLVKSLELNLLEAFKVNSQTAGIYREMKMGYTEFRFSETVARISAPENVVQEVASLLQQHGEFLISAYLKPQPKRSGMDTVFSLEDEISGKAVLAFWTDVNRRKLGLRFLTGERERGQTFKHLNIESEKWYKIFLRVYRKSSNATGVELFIDCEKIGTVKVQSSLAGSIRNRSLRFMLSQRGKGENSSWSKWSGALRDLRLIFNRNYTWYVDPEQCKGDAKAFSQAVPEESLNKCQYTEPAKIDQVTGLLKGLTKMVADIKKDISLQTSDSQTVRRYMEECGFCNGFRRGSKLGKRKPEIDFCSEENNSCDKHADCIVIEGGSSFICQCKVGYGGNGKYCGIDTDLDDIPDDQLPCSNRLCHKDNCPSVPNTGQEDVDGDLKGDICDSDADNDKILNAKDNCPLTANADQKDVDKDWVGDKCDNCPFSSNSNQEPVCLEDRDNDGVGEKDNCPYVHNSDQKDWDQDGVGDACDNCIFKYNPVQTDADNDLVGDECDTNYDTDKDGVQNDKDNCPFVANPDQVDSDRDNRGDKCDDDDDNDNIPDAKDNCPFVHNRDQRDTDGDGTGDNCDGDYDGDQTPDSQDSCPSNNNISRPDFRGLQTVVLDPYGDSQVDPVWKINNEGADIWQLKNSDPGLAIGHARFSGVDFSGTLYINNDDDDDFVGVVFSYQSSSAFYVITWKRKRQTYWKKTPFTAIAEPGLQLKAVYSQSGPGQTLRNALWNSKNTPKEVKILWSDPLQTPWQNKTAYRWEVYHRPAENLIRVRVFSGPEVMADSGNIVDDTHQGGRLGVFCFSQAKVIWSNIHYTCSGMINNQNEKGRPPL